MQTLRKKGSPCKYRNDPGRFFGEGVVFKAKLIGILEVGEARGDRMCQEALQDLKIAIRAAGEHKQRITIHVTIDGLRLRDEKTGDSLYHHPVHKISFIAQDMTDSRAFGYIFGSPDSGHRFFGIKTDKHASQVVLAMRDLFQVVFELKKKEIELARQTIQTKAILGSHHASSLEKRNEAKLTSLAKTSFMDETSFMAGAAGGGSQMGDLVDLEQELSSIQRGITQMEKMTPNELPTKLDSEDPFGDSFAGNTSSNTQFNILPPPPESGSKGRQSKASQQQQQQQQMSIDRKENDWSPPLLPPPNGTAKMKPPTDVVVVDRPSTNSPNPNSDWLSDEAAMSSLFDSRRDDDQEFCSAASGRASGHQLKEDGKFADAFIDLDPLGTGKNRPYVDKKFFFQDVKNPPKKVLKELSSSDVNFIATFHPNNHHDDDHNSSGETRQRKTSSEEEHRYSEQTMFNSSGRHSAPQQQPNQQQQSYFEPFEDPFELVPKVEAAPPPREERRPSVNNSSLSVPLKVILPPETNRSGGTSRGSTPRNRSPNLLKDRGDAGRKSSYESMRRVRHSPDYSTSGDAPEPPPRPEMSHCADPPPLPPKKQFSDVTVRTSNRPSLSNFKLSMSTPPRDSAKADADAPPLPLPSRRVGHTDSKFPGPERPQKQEEDGYMLPTSPNVPVLLPPPKGGSTKRKKFTGPLRDGGGAVSPRLAEAPTSTVEGSEITDITLSQLLQLSLDELADKLSVSALKLSTMTIVELTKYLSEFLSKEKDERSVAEPAPIKRKGAIRRRESNVFKVSFDDDNKDATFVAVFDDNFGEEENEFVADFDNANIQMATSQSQQQQKQQESSSTDRYAVFREIFEEELKSEVPDLLSGEDVERVSVELENDKQQQLELGGDEEDVVPVAPPRIDTSITATISQAKDRYAALRDIVLVENLFEAAPMRIPVESFSPTPPILSEAVEGEEEDEGEPEHTTITSDDHFVSDNFGDFDDERTITSSHINVESPDERTDYELKDKSCTPTFVSARDDLEIDELMNLAVSNLSLNNINSLSPKTTELQLKNASTSPILRGQAVVSPALEHKSNVIDTSTSPIVMHKMVSPAVFERASPQPSVTITPPMATEQEREDMEPKELISEDVGESPESTNGGSDVKLTAKPEEKWTAFEEATSDKRKPGKVVAIGEQNIMESPCSSDDKDELKVLNKKWPKGHTSSSSRDVSPWDDEVGEGRRQVSPGVASDRQGHYMRHGRRMDSCDEDYEYENEYEAGMAREGGRYPQGGRDTEQWHYKYGGHYEEKVDPRDRQHRDPMKLRSGRGYEKRKFYSSHGRKTYDYGEVGGRGGGDGGLPFDIGAPVRASGPGSSRDRMMKREYYGSRERRSFDRESNDSYDSGSGGGGGAVVGPGRKPRREYRNEYYGSIELMPDEYDLDVNKKRYASLEKGHKSSRRSSSRRSNTDAYDDPDESEEGECPNKPHYQRPYLTEGTKSLQRGMNRLQQAPAGNSKSRKGGSSPWDSKPSPIYNKISWSSARPSSASEAGAVDRHRYFSTQALTVGCSDSEKERRQRLKGRSATSSSTVQLPGPQSAGCRRYGNEFTFDEEGGRDNFHAKGVMRKSLRGSREAPMYPEEMIEGGGRGSSRKLNMSADHPKYERTNSRPQPMEGKYYHGREEDYHPHQHHHQQQQQQSHHRTRTPNEDSYEDRMGEEEQGFESDFIASSPIKSAGSIKNRPMFRFSTDYSNNNSPGVESNTSGGGSGQNGSQPKLRFNEKVKVSNYKANYLEDKSDSLESPTGSKDHFEDDFSNLTPEHMAEMGDTWDESFVPPPHAGKGALREKDIRKSESVNIFAKKSDDPFEDDDFFKDEKAAGDHLNWNHNFAKFEDI